MSTITHKYHTIFDSNGTSIERQVNDLMDCSMTSTFCILFINVVHGQRVATVAEYFDFQQPHGVLAHIEKAKQMGAKV
jgi:hypothetical protein